MVSDLAGGTERGFLTSSCVQTSAAALALEVLRLLVRDENL